MYGIELEVILSVTTTATALHQVDFRFPGLTPISYTLWVTSIILLLILHDDAELAGLSSISNTFTSVTQTASLALAAGSHESPWTATVHILWWIPFSPSPSQQSSSSPSTSSKATR
ncbi:uncharacterized protein CCOS01_14702 [Colletotrichum costaricense]|uniref:Uncharacterized protein n=1 Tax=Colletotrichum costaricense TaxID=1209916 RepID=A0AAJ0DU20_9PEZI|nr:uncharacterized protein CCOS01_14702 [Colletotrichum costaricense]KAK1512462.1 hypothetical protein CCOS01_14702 [Colletotrichum costaricense]